MRYVHTNIISKNWRRLADFYIHVFECQLDPPVRKQSGQWLSKGTGVNNAKLQGAHLRLPGYGDNGPTLEIYQYNMIMEAKDSVPNKQGFGHIAFEVKSVSETVEKIEQFGGNKFGEIVRKKIAGVGTITFTYAKDPDGNLIELQSWEK